MSKLPGVNHLDAVRAFRGRRNVKESAGRQPFSVWLERRHSGRDCRNPEAMDGNSQFAQVFDSDVLPRP